MPQTKTRIVCIQLQMSSWFFVTGNRNLRTDFKEWLFARKPALTHRLSR